MLILCFKDFFKKNPTKSFPSSQSVINEIQKIEGDLERKWMGRPTGREPGIESIWHRHYLGEEGSQGQSRKPDVYV